MSINPVSFKSTQGANNSKSNKTNEQQSVNKSFANPNKTVMSWLPYAAGAVILGASAYAFRGKISKILKKAPEVKPEIKQEVKPDVKPEVKPDVKQDAKTPVSSTPNLPAVIYKIDFGIKPPYKKIELKPEVKAQIRGEQPFRFNIPIQNKPEIKPEIKPEVKPDIKPEIKQDIKPEVKIEKKQEVKTDVKPEIKTERKQDAKTEIKQDEKDAGSLADEVSEIDERPRFQNVCAGFDKDGKPIYVIIENNPNIPASGNAYREALESVDFNNQSVISKIESIRKAESDNITRILNENTHDGHVNIPMMKKIAGDYMLDTNRGETRFHQAADLLEQAHIREFVKGDSKMKTGMYNLTDSVTTDPVLYQCYQNMPLEESANRLNYLKEHDLKSESYKEGMDAAGFMNKAFNRLVEKYQFKKYNEAHGIS